MHSLCVLDKETTVNNFQCFKIPCIVSNTSLCAHEKETTANCHYLQASANWPTPRCHMFVTENDERLRTSFLKDAVLWMTSLVTS